MGGWEAFWSGESKKLRTHSPPFFSQSQGSDRPPFPSPLSRAMGAYLSAPVTTKEVFEGGNAALSYGGATMQVSVRFRGVKTVRAPPSQARAMVW